MEIRVSASPDSFKTLPINWFSLVVAPGVDTSMPGVYQWEIEGVGLYVGKYTHFSRPMVEYERNVIKMLNRRPYRPKKPTAFRRIHRELYAAALAGIAVKLTILENCQPDRLTARERELIAERGTLNGRAGRYQIAA
jgi:hypothetical protein